eukprot:COSAG01_NODE_1624_length_9704_cov_186.948777_1_plen_34_part_10
MGELGGGAEGERSPRKGGGGGGGGPGLQGFPTPP